MYRSTRFDSKTELQFKLPWDGNTARGFAASLVIFLLFVFASQFFEIRKAKPRELYISSLPIELLNFGDGDGTGLSSGNLTEEGKKHKGKTPQTSLDDAQVKSKTKRSVNSVDLDQAANYIAVNELSSSDNSKSSGGSDPTNIGSLDGDPLGRGLGDEGVGSGKGLGLGDIDLGGGGNRIVVSKYKPKFPKGVNFDAKVKVRFEVMPDGTVSKIVPLQKADPLIEKEVIAALSKWRFNKIDRDVIMVGIIPVTFVLR